MLFLTSEISDLKLVAVAAAICTIRHTLRSCAIVIYIDYTAALAAIVKGPSPVPSAARLLSFLRRTAAL